ncbi:MaoC/PaaZ C-terminal domain-containing protein [Marinobacter caseinilyticus]|uniref:MaoC/PaaZ C-terminal domain-containing protein n=1 Tax=Marinobacter caseinilyticus TaxID=2692195 RepID=UPI001407E449|nr:MaoC/PaaZ C-terminal domain-containing protein [Marinobacter caseinilyticus]
MQDWISYRNQGPRLWPLYGKAVVPRTRRPKNDDIRIPALQTELIGTATGGNRLHRYRELCGFARRSTLPPTWPHVLAFPLHLKLLTEQAFPLPLLGLVHLRNRIIQQRAIGVGELLDIRAHLDGQTVSDRGLEFDLITEAWSAGKKVWEEVSTSLFREPRHNGASLKPTRTFPALPHYPNSLTLAAAASIGRQYGRLSGDLNPIHIHLLTAKVFGFPRAIAHGMWSQAHCIALLEQQQNWPGGPMTVACQFKKPLLLPGTAQLNWQSNNDHWDYQLLNTQGNAPHLTGNITFG